MNGHRPIIFVFLFKSQNESLSVSGQIKTMNWNKIAILSEIYAIEFIIYFPAFIIQVHCFFNPFWLLGL